MYGADLRGRQGDFILLWLSFASFYNRINNIAPRFLSEKAASYEQELCEMSAGKKWGEGAAVGGWGVEGRGVGFLGGKEKCQRQCAKQL